MKKVISYSLWGDNPKYTIGAIENVKLQKQFYSDWICRFYVHDSVPEEIVTTLINEGAEIIRKTGDLGVHMDRPGMFWRFEVINDPKVERFIIRDADSRLSQREKNCVIDWIRSKKSLHIIRDHPHHRTRIMGGMWGGINADLQFLNYDDLCKQFETLEYVNLYATDQEFLARMIYPLIKHSLHIHDNHHFYPDEKVFNIPHLQINNEFIGQPVEIS